MSHGLAISKAECKGFNAKQYRVALVSTAHQECLVQVFTDDHFVTVAFSTGLKMGAPKLLSQNDFYGHVFLRVQKLKEQKHSDPRWSGVCCIILQILRED